jgi:hypothetical protein
MRVISIKFKFNIFFIKEFSKHNIYVYALINIIIKFHEYFYIYI